MRWLWLCTVSVLGSCVIVVPAASAASEMPWPSRLFRVASSQSFEDAIQDVVVTPDGRLFIASGAPESRDGGDVWELRSDGRLTPVVHLPAAGGRAGVGLLAEPDGVLLVIDGWGDRVLRVLPSGESTVIAGTGKTGFSGDGGPAQRATLNLGRKAFVGPARLGDGSIVFPDSWNNRVRRIRPDGVIETIAGVGPAFDSPGSAFCPPKVAVGDGGPATLATLCLPTDVLAAADGSIVVSDTNHGRIRRIASDGTITSLGGQLPLTTTGLAQLPNGDILFGHLFGISRLTPDGRYSPFLTYGGDFNNLPMVDFAGRLIGAGAPLVSGLRVTREGGVLFAARDAYYLAPRRTWLTLVGIRDARVSADTASIDFDATRAARATIVITRNGRHVAAASRTIRAGRRRLSVAGSFRSRPYQVDVALKRRDGAAARDTISLYLGDQLRLSHARRLATTGLDPELKLGGCDRMTARRIDCWYIPGPESASHARCIWINAYRLRHTGQIWGRRYRCPSGKPRVRLHPAWVRQAWRAFL